MPDARDPREFVRDITVESDGNERVRTALPHSRDKLGILRYYFPGFTRASQRYPRYFVDACSGPGLYHFPDTDEYALGSSLIALSTGSRWETKPPEVAFTKVLSLELDPQQANALRARTKHFGARSVVEEGNCNIDLLPLMRKHVPPRSPLTVFLDPQAFEVEWRTVEAVSRFRSNRLTEMLILVNPTAVLRVLGAGGSTVDGAFRAFPPGSDLERIGEARRREEINPPRAKELIVDAFVDGLRELGYQDPISRAITRPGPNPFEVGGEVYHLVFATTVPAGNAIMESAFNRIYTNQAEANRSPQLEMELGIEQPPSPHLPGARRSPPRPPWN